MSSLCALFTRGYWIVVQVLVGESTGDLDVEGIRCSLGALNKNRKFANKRVY